MTIFVQAPDHPNKEKLEEYYTAALRKRFDKHSFIMKCLCKIKMDSKNEIVTTLEVHSKSSKPFFAKSKSHCENRALLKAIKKINRQIETYKTKRFSISLSLQKSNNQFVFKTS